MGERSEPEWKFFEKFTKKILFLKKICEKNFVLFEKLLFFLQILSFHNISHILDSNFLKQGPISNPKPDLESPWKYASIRINIENCTKNEQKIAFCTKFRNNAHMTRKAARLSWWYPNLIYCNRSWDMGLQSSKCLHMYKSFRHKTHFTWKFKISKRIFSSILLKSLYIWEGMEPVWSHNFWTDGLIWTLRPDMESQKRDASIHAKIENCTKNCILHEKLHDARNFQKLPL